MNREIKFRGMNNCVDVKYWVYGYFWVNLYLESHYIMQPSKKGIPSIINFAVDPKTVGQFTGIKDKNDKEGYYKDICLYKDDSGKLQKGVIEWRDSSAGFYLEAIGGDDEGNQDGDLDRPFEIIGNVFENPLLLVRE